MYKHCWQWLVPPMDFELVVELVAPGPLAEGQIVSLVVVCLVGDTGWQLRQLALC